MASITGTGSLTSSVATLAAAGVRRITASGALSSGNITLAGSGKKGIKGTGAVVVTKGNLSASVNRGISGSGSLTVQKATLSSEGITPDNRSWDNNNAAWGDADFIYSEAKPIMLVGNEFYQADNGTKFGEENVKVVLSRTGLTVYGRARDGNWKVDPTSIKEVTGIYPVMRADPGTVVQISVGKQDAPDDPVTWEGPYNFTIGVDFYQDFVVSGRYIGVRFESEGQAPWELLGYDLEITRIGGR